MINNILHDISWVLPFRNDALTIIFEGFTWLGYPIFIIFFLPVLYWSWNKEAATRVMMIVMLSSLLNAFLKDFWMNPRPDIAFQMDPEVAQSYGMPSGHAQVSAVLWFWLAYELRKPWFWLLSAFVMTMICLSRLYLGVHDLEDILAGLILAGITAFMFRLSLSAPLQWFRHLDAHWHIPMLLILMAFLTMIWPKQANSYETLVVGALMMSWLYGRQLEKRYIGFTLRNTLWGWVYLPSIIAGLFGVISLLLLSTILRNLLENLSPLSSAFISLLISGLFMTLGVPTLLKKMRLSQQENI